MSSNKINKANFKSNFLKGKDNYKKAFVSLESIEDSQSAIDEFLNLDENILPGRTTLYIYGVLQSLFCQQDGILHLYKLIVDNSIKIGTLFEQFHFDSGHREIRNDIVGHPTNRNNGKELYYLAKGSNTKYAFTYAGFTQNLEKFRVKDVDLRKLITEQEIFVTEVLNAVNTEIDNKIQELKTKFKDMKLLELTKHMSDYISKIFEGISHDYPPVKGNINCLTKAISSIKEELHKRYNNAVPYEILQQFDLLDYILEKFINWVDKDELIGNMDAKVFHEGLERQFEELESMLKSIDEEFK
jgi:hypothetical protein